MTLADIARLTDLFTIGGTKNGALLGEAMVIRNERLREDFRRCLKQRGALLAKGWVLGAQFAALFSDNLYFSLAKHANDMAGRLAEGIGDLGFSFLAEPATNTIFPIFPNRTVQQLQREYGFYTIRPTDDNRTAIRLVTSWATKETHVEAFLTDLKKLT